MTTTICITARIAPIAASATSRRRNLTTGFAASTLLRAASSLPSSFLPTSPPLNHHSRSNPFLHQKAFVPGCAARASSPEIAFPASEAVVLPEAEAPSWPFREPIGRTLLWVLLLAPVCSALGLFGCCSAVAATGAAADDSIRASKIGLRIAMALRRTGLADEAIVFALATLPVLELRGAIPVGYWMQLEPLLLTVLSVLGNMVPVPLIILYLKRLTYFFSQRSASATRFLDLLLQRAREKAGPVKEFQWLGLMLFVAVPFPGTGAWTGAIVASVLDMPFWSAVSANFVGVVLAGLLVNLLVNLGLKYAIVTGALLFLASTFMWSVLRRFKNS